MASRTDPANSPADPAAPGDTAALPPVPTPPPDATRWAGRAAVPPRRLAEEDAQAWIEPPPSRLFPVFVTAVVVLLLGVLAFGAVLILRDEPPVPAPPTEPVRTSVAVTTPPSQPAPTTASATATAELVIPPLLGQDYEDAAAALTALGLVPQRRDVFHEWPVGVVTGTDPGESTAVQAGATVTVFVSKGQPPTTPPPTAGPSEPEPTGSGTRRPR